ncbi:hypothetical protein EGW08_018789 [Elysia chlorotica]|uniref:Uncharacterized protein n=1 Tax=Elysia chlorotica TaxID=188477 RepID=A0A3S0Z8Z4_ELYCH|nr:hypothetical protein EGW08_018789 [Elysia chlorotica]
MASKDDRTECWGWSHGGGESERDAEGGEEGATTYGLSNACSAKRSSAELAAENRRLHLDNMRLWDCLALFRSDPSLTCQGAINTIFTLNDTEYLREFPDTQQLLDSRLPEGLGHHHNELDPASENNRLREENTRLHAAVWVLRDNPSLHADSTVAAVFRLNDAQFQRKFGVVNQVTAGLCYRNIFERSSRNNNKVKVKAMRTHLDLGARSNTIHLIKKPLGPKRLARAKSMSSNRYLSPPRECSATALISSRKRSESAEPLQNFSSNRKPSSPEEMRDFIYDKYYYGSGPLFVSDVTSFFAGDTSGDCEKQHESTWKSKSKNQGGVVNSVSDTSQSCATNRSKEHCSNRRAAKPIKCVSFEEPLPSRTSVFDKPSERPRDSEGKYSLYSLGDVKTNGKHKSYNARLQDILYSPVDGYSNNFAEYDVGILLGRNGKETKTREKGRTSSGSRKSSHRSASLTCSPTNTYTDHDEVRRKRAGSEKGDRSHRESRLQTWDLSEDFRGSNSNRMGSRCPADDDEEDDDEGDELERGVEEDDNGSFRGPYYSLSGRSRRPGKIRIKAIHREPSKRHKQDIRLSPVLDPRASLHRMHVSAGDGSLLHAESHFRDGAGHNINFNKSESLEDISEEAIHNLNNSARIKYSKESIEFTNQSKLINSGLTDTTSFVLDHSDEGRKFQSGLGIVNAQVHTPRIEDFRGREILPGNKGADTLENICLDRNHNAITKGKPKENKGRQVSTRKEGALSSGTGKALGPIDVRNKTKPCQTSQPKTIAVKETTTLKSALKDKSAERHFHTLETSSKAGLPRVHFQSNEDLFLKKSSLQNVHAKGKATKTRRNTINSASGTKHRNITKITNHTDDDVKDINVNICNVSPMKSEASNITINPEHPQNKVLKPFSHGNTVNSRKKSFKNNGDSTSNAISQTKHMDASHEIPKQTFSEKLNPVKSKNTIEDRKATDILGTVCESNLEVFTDQKNRSYRKNRASQDDVMNHSDPGEFSGRVRLSDEEGIIPYDQIKMRLNRPKSAGMREFASLRQANLMHSKTAKEFSEPNSREGSVLLYQAEPKSVPHKKKLIFHSETASVKSYHKTEQMGQSSSDDFLSEPEVYLSTQPAPDRASRYKPYPHRTYLTAKHFTDRHQRLMPLPTPTVRRDTSAMFSFSREKSPSMALVLDDDYQRWMVNRVRASEMVVKRHGMTNERLDQQCRRRFKYAYKRNLEYWPRPEPPRHKIYEILSNYASTRDSSFKMAKGCLKECQIISNCVPNEVRLRKLKDLGGVKYKAALAAMIKHNMPPAEKEPCASKSLGTPPNSLFGM